ncbi:MAG: UPF0149 family protein [Thiotrichales bacterium]|jgi:hypothetical protein|nr:UPF0149 family protein [Thiotrichales bacterium]MBT3613419.1 UPF0149 family protein [Thiotrichales bacterium]MBT3837597.1 UPF0149 family protein [Thiotrichales bacterium]MBT6172645.1 UPF0149 family protein [Thiotrichales bacterium]MBT6810526.1 UPF0149 family protein [Thiotrichales bacterium]
MNDNISYNDLDEAVQRLSLTMDGAELHGAFCGRMMLGSEEDGASWLRELVGERDEANLQARDDVKTIAVVMGESVRQLDNDQLHFDLLLPDDNESLDIRTEGLAAWCEGFLYGYGVAVAGDSLAEKQMQREFIRDLLEISQAGFEHDEETEEDESDFMQIVEHLRVGTMLLYEEGQQQRVDEMILPKGSYSDSSPETMH